MNNVFLLAVLGAAALASLLGAMPMRGSATDTTFATKFAQAGMAEIALAKVALQRSHDPKVIAFAKKMVADHTKAGNKLMAIASAESMSLPGMPSPQDMATKAALANAPAAKFDATYRKDNIAGHAKALALLDTEIAGGKDSKLVTYAKMTKPTVEQHRMLSGALPTM